jgi:PhnB protein
MPQRCGPKQLIMRLAPYIIFDGRCEEALNFYAKAFDGQILNIQRYDGAPVDEAHKPMPADKIMHAQFHAGDLFLMASDGPIPEGTGSNVHLSVDNSNVEEQTRVFEALSEGGKVKMPLQETFWGARFGMLTDQFGINWMFNYDKPKD